MPRRTLKHIKIVRSKGRTYVYFDTGRTKPNGQPVLVSMPPLDDPGFPGAYAAQCRQKTMRASPVDIGLTVPQLATLYYKSPDFRKLADSTRKVYRIYIDRLSALLPTAPAGELEPSDIRRLADNMADTPGAANLLVSTCSTLYRWGRSRGHVQNNPTRDIGMLELGEHDPWPADLLDAGLEAEDQRIRLAIHLLYFTAQRIGDVTRMRWSDVRDDRIVITAQKTGRRMDIPLHATLASELARAPRAGMTMLTRQDGKPISAARLRELIKAFAQEHGRDIVPHGLRKNAVNALLEAGCTVAETAAISGQTLQMVEHYAKMRSQSKLATAAILKWQGNAK